MQYLVLIILTLLQLKSVKNFNFHLDNIQDYCFTIVGNQNDTLHLEYQVRDKEILKEFKQVIISPNKEIVRKKKQKFTEIENGIKLNYEFEISGRYDLCFMSITARKKVVNVFWYISDQVNKWEQNYLEGVLDKTITKEVIKDIKDDQDKMQELIQDINIAKSNHLELFASLDDLIEQIKTKQYIKLYVVIAIVLLQLFFLSTILKNKINFIQV